MKTQDPKFTIENNRLIDQSGSVPDDEPLFILRGSDFNAVETLAHYLSLCSRSSDANHIEAVCHRIVAFDMFRRNHASRMGNPATDLALIFNQSK